MLKLEVWPWFRKLFSKGANTDVEKEMLPEGVYVDAENMELGSVSGNLGSLQKIGGETVRFVPGPGEPNDYTCIGAWMASADEVSWFAHEDAATWPPIMKVNGVTMVRSFNIPYRWDRPLQATPVNRKQGGFLFPADGESEQLFWDIEAIKAANAANEQTYLDEFDIQNVTVLLAGPDEWPEHEGNPSIGTGASVGKYIFFLRNYNADGDRSNRGPETLPIDVAEEQAPVYINPANVDGQYPGGQTTGGVVNPDALIPTKYGIALRWQVDNFLGFAGQELMVRRYNDGQGLNGPGITEVIARLPMQPDEFAPREFVYPRDNNFFEEIPTLGAQDEQVNFFAAKGQEYINNRVEYFNFRLKDRIVDLTFRDVNGDRTFPFTDRVFTRYGGQDYNDGYSDPVNNTYKKTAVHNERYNVGLMLWDGNASRSPVVPVAQNVTMPERARRKAGDSDFYSSDRIYRTNTECQGNDPVSPTFDAIVQGKVRKYGAGPESQTVNVIAGVNYAPWAPKAPDDPDSVRYRVAPVGTWYTSDLSGPVPNTGFCFANEVHALGLGVYGPTNLRQAAPWARVISPMRTAQAGRVIAEGFAVYDVDFYNNAVDIGNSKNPPNLRAFFPDFESGVVPASVIDDVMQNPRNYALKFTPYGFHGEIFSRRGDEQSDPRFTHAIDIITTGNIQFDPGTSAAYPEPRSVNAGEPPNAMGVQPTFSAPPFPNNYVGYQGYRRLTADNLNVLTTDENNAEYLTFMDPDNTDQGAVEIGLQGMDVQVEGRGRLWKIRLADRVYRRSGTFSGHHFSEDSTRRFHEAFWTVSLIRSANEVPEVNIQSYVLGGQHIAVDRTIGIFQPDANGAMDIEMFHARPFDAIGRTPNDFRYAYVREDSVPERRWLCATNNATVFAQFNTIVSDINANGFWVAPDGLPVYGLYRSFTNVDIGPHPVTFLQFGVFAPVMAPPATGARIVVKYNENEPILMQGFDATIAPAVWANLDRVFNANNGLTNDQGNNQAFTSVPLPYGGGVGNSDYNLPRDANGTGGNQLEPFEFGRILSYRQWIVMADLVTRTPQRLNTGGGNDIRWSFPRNHYINRPSRFDAANQTGAANGFNPQFDVDFPNEAVYFAYGGFRFQNTYNLDYSKAAAITGLGIPSNGQTPRTYLPTGMIVSEAFDVLAQDRPGLRTFSYQNLLVASEENGEINFMASLDQGAGQQLFGWAANGYFRVPYNKQILTGADGNLIGTQSVSTFWPREEQWIARGDHGMPDQMWRHARKANVPSGKSNIDTVFWTDRVSAYQLIGGVAKDIAIGEYQKVLQPILGSTFADYRPGYASNYNRKNNEWWMQTIIPGTDGKPDEIRTFVYSPVANQWVGAFTYSYDQYLANSLSNVGFRSTGANNLGVGLVMADGTPVAGWAETAFTPYPGMQSELVSWRVNPDKPDEMRIYDKNHVLMVRANEAFQEAFEPGTGFLWVMEIDGWQQMMNSTLASYHPDRQPPQSTGYYMRIFFNREEQQRITFASVQSKSLP